MYRKLLALLLVGVVSMSSLTGCGGSSEPAATEAKTEDTAPTNDSAEPVAADTGDDADAGEENGSITFADLQKNYETMTDVYNKVNDLYMNDGIEQSDDVEELLTEAKGIIDEIGELTEDQFTDEQSMTDMNDSMVKIIEGLGNVVDMMDVKSEDGDGEAADDSGEADSSAWDAFDEFYAGVTDDENTYMLLAFGNDGALGCVMFVDTSTSKSGSWVGDVTTDEENNLLSISDENNGTSLGFSVEASGNGYKLDMGDLGTALVGSVDKDAFAAAAKEVEEGSVPQF